jgi:hypothetical protein
LHLSEPPSYARRNILIPGAFPWAGMTLAPSPSSALFHTQEPEPMSHEAMRSCIDACNECALECEHCATACLNETEVKALARCIALDLECAEICRTATIVMARGSERAGEFCQLCADVCEDCARECERHKHMDHCRRCAEACRRCAEECRRMAGSGARQESRRTSEHAAH